MFSIFISFGSGHFDCKPCIFVCDILFFNSAILGILFLFQMIRPAYCLENITYDELNSLDGAEKGAFIIKFHFHREFCGFTMLTVHILGKYFCIFLR